MRPNGRPDPEGQLAMGHCMHYLLTGRVGSAMRMGFTHDLTAQVDSLSTMPKRIPVAAPGGVGGEDGKPGTRNVIARTAGNYVSCPRFPALFLLPLRRGRFFLAAYSSRCTPGGPVASINGASNTPMKARRPASRLLQYRGRVRRTSCFPDSRKDSAPNPFLPQTRVYPCSLFGRSHIFIFLDFLCGCRQSA